MSNNRYDRGANLVRAVDVQGGFRPSPSVLMDFSPPVTIDVDAALQSHEGATETTTGMDRSRALIVRLVPFSVIWLILAVGVSWAASMGGWFTLIFFAALTSVTYAYLDRQEYQFSRNGLERHKVNTLADLKRDEMAHHQELRRMALRAHLKMLELQDNDNPRSDYPECS